MQSEFDQVPVSDDSFSQQLPFMMANLPSFLIHPSPSFTQPDTFLMAGQPSAPGQDGFPASLMGLQAQGNPHSSDATHISPALVTFPAHTPSANTSTASLSTSCVSELFPVGDSNTVDFLDIPHNTDEVLLNAKVVDPTITSAPMEFLRPRECFQSSSRPSLPLIDSSVAPRPNSQVLIDAALITAAPRATKQQDRARKLDPRVPRAPAARKTKQPRAGATQPPSSQLQSANKQARIDWTTWTETITHFYLVENHTAKEVSFEMWALYGEQVA